MTTRYITDVAEQSIVQLLDEWATGRLGTGLSWANLQKAFGYSRQALSGNPRIKAKFNETKQALKALKTRVQRAGSVEDELERLRQENAELKARVVEYEKRFTRWIHNCYKRAINPLDLDAPMGLSPKTAGRSLDSK
jgi:hypothetical protein